MVARGPTYQVVVRPWAVRVDDVVLARVDAVLDRPVEPVAPEAPFARPDVADPSAPLARLDAPLARVVVLDRPDDWVRVRPAGAGGRAGETGSTRAPTFALTARSSASAAPAPPDPAVPDRPS